MSPYVGLFSAWVVVTLAFVVLLIYRSRLESQEADWIPLTEDEREERAIRQQTLVEMKTRKLTWPIRILGILSALLLLAIGGYWLYRGIMYPPPPPGP